MVFWTEKIYIHLCTDDDDDGGHNDHINELSFEWWRPRSYAPHNLLFSICFSFFQCRGCSPEKLTHNANYLSWPSQSMSYPSGVRGVADKVSGLRLERKLFELNYYLIEPCLTWTSDLDTTYLLLRCRLAQLNDDPFITHSPPPLSAPVAVVVRWWCAC